MPERDLANAAASIERLRALRVRPDRARPASEAVGELHRRIETEVKQTGGMGEVWRAVAPDDVRARTRVRSFRRGVLTIETTDAATRWLVERWLRGGGRETLVGCAPGTVRRVVVRVVS